MKKLPVTEEHLRLLASYGLEDYPKNEIQCLCFSPQEQIACQGHPLPGLYILTEGQAKVCNFASNGKTIILSYYLSSGFIGEVEMMENSAEVHSTVMAISQCTCLLLTAKHNQAFLEAHPLFLYRVSMSLAILCQQSNRFTIAASLFTAEQRLCAYILQTAENGIFCKVLTEVSACLGMSYRHLFRLLDKLCKEGYLEKTKKGYRLLKEKEMAKKADLWLPDFQKH